MTTQITGADRSKRARAMKASPAPIRSEASRTKRISSTSRRLSRATSFRRLPSASRGRCRPGVSTKTIWASGSVRMPRTAWRVVCGLSDTIATLLETSRFSRLDLPTLGRPTRQTKPERWEPRSEPVTVLRSR